MEYILSLIDFILHINVHLDTLVTDFGPVVYVFLFLIIFCETGLVVTPFLPGDSLLFAAGAIAAGGGLNVWILMVLFLIAGIAGDTVNYWIGRFAGEQLLTKFPKIIKPYHLEQTHTFFERYGGKTIVFARFVPVVRTLAPFVAGAGEMSYGKFMRYNVIGGGMWVFLFVPLGYFFGNISFVQNNFSFILLFIIALSFLPPFIEVVLERRRFKRSSV